MREAGAYGPPLSMQVAHIIPARDKAARVAKTVHSVLNQTYPCHVVLSDQGSTDGTLQIMRDIALEYRGPHKVSVLSCPDTEPKGMRGMNAHLDWIMSVIDEDVVLITSADDIAYSERTAKVVRAFIDHRPDMVLTAIHFVEPNGDMYGITGGDLPEGFVTPTLCLEGMVGGSTSHAMTRDFYEAVGGFKSIAGFDAYMPFLATVRKGAWFVKEPLHAYVRHADPKNTGLEGVYRAADERGKVQLEELMHFQCQTAFVRAALVMQSWGEVTEEARNAIFNQILGRAASWSAVRERMSVEKIEPISLKA